MNILITGGSRGLGKAMVSNLASDPGNHVFFTYCSSAEAARNLAVSFSNTTAIHCNFTDPASVDQLVAGLPDMKIEVLVNNAFVSYSQTHFYKIPADDFVKSFTENIYPVLRITQGCIQLFRKQRFGKIINIISSYCSGNPPIGLSEYVANKSYLLSMSKSWAIENIRFNITSNSVSPSFLQTDFTADTDERVVEDMVSSHPLKKLITPEEVAASVHFLVHCTQQINGINLLMNAGTHII